MHCSTRDDVTFLRIELLITQFYFARFLCATCQEIPLLGQLLPILPEHLSSHPVLVEIGVALFSVVCVQYL